MRGTRGSESRGLAIEPRYAPHFLPATACGRGCQDDANRLPADGIGDSRPDDLLGFQPHGPARSAFGRCPAHHRDDGSSARRRDRARRADRPPGGPNRLAGVEQLQHPHAPPGPRRHLRAVRFSAANCARSFLVNLRPNAPAFLIRTDQGPRNSPSCLLATRPWHRPRPPARPLPCRRRAGPARQLPARAQAQGRRAAQNRRPAWPAPSILSALRATRSSGTTASSCLRAV